MMVLNRFSLLRHFAHRVFTRKTDANALKSHSLPDVKRSDVIFQRLRDAKSRVAPRSENDRKSEASRPLSIFWGRQISSTSTLARRTSRDHLAILEHVFVKNTGDLTGEHTARGIIKNEMIQTKVNWE